jgi:hypothetical protein
MRKLAALAATAWLAACTMPLPDVALPPVAGSGLADPGRGAILNTSYAFATAGRLAGRPADAAIAIAQAEFLTVDLVANQRWREYAPNVALGFRQARPEWRAAAGIAPEAPPQPVIDALFGAAAALGRGDANAAAAALPALLFQDGGAASLARLAALPALPLTATIARQAENELNRVQMQPDE